MQPTFSHFGICVADLDLSLRFYCGAFGFERAEAHQIGRQFAGLMELDDVELRSQFIRRADTAIELLAFTVPAPTGQAVRRPINRLGLTHLAFRVDDVAATAEAVERLGGQVVAGTRTSLSLGGTELGFVYCTDPDGVRIELMDLGPR